MSKDFRARALAKSQEWASRAVSKQVHREPQEITAEEFLHANLGLPEKIELVDGLIGPISDHGMQTLLANWGADRILRVTGSEVWREALAALDKKVR